MSAQEIQQKLNDATSKVLTAKVDVVTGLTSLNDALRLVQDVAGPNTTVYSLRQALTVLSDSVDELRDMGPKLSTVLENIEDYKLIVG